ncbi:MAG: 3-hydroxyacyl-ACP dehydratase FabZ [Lentisphaeria bacterium]|nr:3-hydroxyacyl-ACP dehydratase FabZ [Lentisphaeria bacterium]
MEKVLGLKEIMSILPQRSPMLLLDRAQQIDEKHWTGAKNVSMDEAFFQGHFPGHPIMPGVLQLEAMKQLCELAVRDVLDPAGAADVYLKEVNKVKFRRPANPGDRLKIDAEILEMEANNALLKAVISTSAGVASEAQITLAVRDRAAGPESMPQLFNEYDKNDAVLMDISKVMDLMPHRFPFLLIDYVFSMEGERVIAVKNVTANEPIFANDSQLKVLPESILCEIAAQSGCACVLARPENAGKIGYFMAIDHAESLAPVYPGDQLVIDLILPPAKSRFGKGGCEIRVDGKVVFKINLMFAIVDA